MSENYRTLSDDYKKFQENGFIDIDIPRYIERNLADWIDLRYYQEEAISYFNYYLDDDNNRENPVHLLYHMATGSGKTIVMAANILELYNRGYNNFIFFVDSNTVIQKTKENFLNQGSSKYLFDEDISFSERDVRTKSVDNFSTVSSGEINIHFTTIQGLHKALKDPKENSITYEEFEDKKLVLLSDESHHLDQETKNENDGSNWERTVMNILNKNDENILLEYTATPGLDNQAVAEKYEDKIIYQYPLEQYRDDGFSKEVNVHEADVGPLGRAMRALILSQYRKKVAERNDERIKPVVLMKSSHVNPPSTQTEKKVVSSEFRETFYGFLDNLDETDLREIKRNASDRVKDAFEFF
jgi:type III restriction enzyme